MKRYLAMLIVFAFATVIVTAEENKPAADAKEMTLTGKLLKIEKKDGEKVKISYSIETADGKIELPKTEVKLDELVDQQVEVAVKAIVHEMNGKKHTKVKEVVSVKKVEAAKAVEAPKAPEAPAVPVAPAVPAVEEKK